MKAHLAGARYRVGMRNPQSTNAAIVHRPEFDGERRALLGLAAFALAWPAAVGAAEPEMKGDRSMSAAIILGVVNQYADAWRRGDIAAIIHCYHPDFTLHYPGDHALAGTHVGKEASVQVLAEVSRRTKRSLVDIISVMAGEERGAIIARERWHRDGEEAIVERVLVYAVQDGKLRDCWLYDADQKAVARFLG